MPNSTSVSETRSCTDDLLPLIESALAAACPEGDGCPEHLSQAIRYALLAPGKRLRPALVLMAAEACGGSFDEAMPGAVAVEMVHAYSLVHDDLPAMDDDDLRRGRPTVHVEFDEATAILAGDALQAMAWAHLAQQIPDPVRAVGAMRVLAVAAGPQHLVGGQAADLAAEGSAEAPKIGSGQHENSPGGTDLLAHLESIHRRKTGALFTASLEIGAILSGANSSQRQILRNYARELGLAFQVVDDLLDFTSNEDSLGKRAGKDASRGKLTYPGLLGVDNARQRAIGLIEASRRHVAVFGDSAWRLTALANYVLERTH